MQLKTLHQGNKCSWHDCSWLMSFPPNRDWFNLHDIYLFVQSLALWGPRLSSHTYWTYTGIIISPIDSPGFNTCHLRLLAYHRLSLFTHRPLCFPDKAGIDLSGCMGIMHATQLSGAETQRPSSRHALAGPQSQPHRFPITVSLWRPL